MEEKLRQGRATIEQIRTKSGPFEHTCHHQQPQEPKKTKQEKPPSPSFTPRHPATLNELVEACHYLDERGFVY
jgi:hypothetical protein